MMLMNFAMILRVIQILYFYFVWLNIACPETFKDLYLLTVPFV